MLAQTEKINANIRKILDTATLEWGVEVTLVELKDIQLPGQHETRGGPRRPRPSARSEPKSLRRKGNHAAAALGEASDTMMEHPLALQLRNLQTLVELGVEKKNTTIVFPAPLMSAIGELTGFLTPEQKRFEDHSAQRLTRREAVTRLTRSGSAGPGRAA